MENKYDTLTRNMTILDCIMIVNKMATESITDEQRERPYKILCKVQDMLHEFLKEEKAKQDGK